MADPSQPTPVISRLREKVRRLPHRPGVYLMKDRLGMVLYIGKAKDLQKRVSSYFRRNHPAWREQPKIAAMISLIHDLETVEVRSDTEAVLLEGKLLKDWKPKYNTDFVDDKRFPLVRLTEQEMFPRFRIARLRLDDGARYFGPFAGGQQLRRTLAEMRRQFGVLLGETTTPQPIAGTDKYRLFNDVRAEIYGHPNEVTPAEYAGRVRAAVEFLEGKARDWMEQTRAQMLAAAQQRNFERAAELRDLLQAITQTSVNAMRTRRFLRGDPVKFLHSEEAARELAQALGLAAPPRTLECFDISHISGQFAVASLVRFADGAPDKAGYRLFHIRGDIHNDDFRAMEQVVTRRYLRLHREGKPFPDLLVIDGGKGQVHAAVKAFLALEVPPPPLIGLAKKEETIVFPGDRADLRLPVYSPGLKLLQRLRDEAHRFANTFNAKLRSKKIRESVLDDFLGLGPARKAALMARFKNIARLRAASAEEIVEVPGFGAASAAKLKAYLEQLK